MALSSLALTLTRTARRRSQAISITCALAVVSLVMIVLAVPAISFDLSFSWPFLDSNVVYGVFLAIAGFLSVLVGITMLSAVRAR
jgi:drug/metabolite transporter (DMT)-like permease